MDIVIAGAHHMEMDPLREKLQKQGYQTSDDRNVYRIPEGVGHILRVIETGIGLEKSEHQLSSALGRLTELPDLLINFGTCGGIHPDSALGDLILVTATVSEEGEIPLESGEDTYADLLGRYLKKSDIPYRTGPVYSTEKAITDEVARDEIYRTSGALAVNMESYSLAKVCSNRKLPMVSIKYVSDNADEFALKDFMANLDEAAQRLGDLAVGYLDSLN